MSDEGLLANAEAPVEDAPAEDVAETTTTPPDGSQPVDAPERPDYIPENFWDGDKGEVNTEALAKSYADLRNAFNEKNNDKPGESIEDYMTGEMFTEEGKLTVGEVEIPKDDPALQAAMDIAKETGLGVKQAQEFIGKFVGKLNDIAPVANAIDPQAELEKLGENGTQLVSGLKVWVDGMKSNGELNDDVHSALMELGSTAAGIKALDVLRQKTGELTLPVGEALSGTTHMSLEDWYSASYETHAEGGESRDAYDRRMHDLGQKLIGSGHGTYNGSGFGTGRR